MDSETGKKMAMNNGKYMAIPSGSSKKMAMDG
jgi:hypothetical protein